MKDRQFSHLDKSKQRHNTVTLTELNNSERLSSNRNPATWFECKMPLHSIKKLAKKTERIFNSEELFLL